MKDVIILAKGESRRLCPFDAQEVWGVKDVCTYPDFLDKRFDRIFDFEPRQPNYISKLKGHKNENIKITSWQDYGEIKYPLLEIHKHFNLDYIACPNCGGTGIKDNVKCPRCIQGIIYSGYFTNTLSYMIALAIYEGFNPIRLYGVDAPFGGVYFLEKSGIEYWVGRAQSLGVKVEISKGSHVLRTKTGQLYGMKEDEGRTLLYLQERIAIMALLPVKGYHEEDFIANQVRNIVAVKEPEGKEHNVSIVIHPNGQPSYKCDHEFQAELWLPDYAWAYIRDKLVTLEKQRQLPVACLSLYEKLVGFCETENLGTPPKIETNKNVRVSYILPTKDRPEFLKRSLENVRKLLTPDDELIVVDASTKDNSAILKEYSDIIDLVVKEPDSGPGDGFNKGVLCANGKYVKWLTDDDIIFPDAMEQAINHMEHHTEIDLLVCGGIKRTALGDHQIIAPKNYGHDYKDIWKYGACGIGFIFRYKSFSKIGMLDSTHMIPDQEFALRAIERGKVEFFPARLYHHPIYNHSTSIRDRVEWKRQEKDLIIKYSGRACYYRTIANRKLNNAVIRFAKSLNK